MKKFCKVILSCAVLAAVSLTGCGDKEPEIVIGSGDDKVVVNLGDAKDSVTASGTLTTKDISFSEGEYSLVISDISYRDSTVKINIASSGTNASLECDDNIIGELDLSVNEDTKTIALGSSKPNNMYNNMKLTLNVNAAVTSVRCGGSAEISYNSPDNAEKISLDISGTAALSGAGNCKNLDVNASGGADVNVSALNSENVSVNASGASQVNVKASESVAVEASGASNVKYSCDTDNVTENISGTAAAERV